MIFLGNHYSLIIVKYYAIHLFTACEIACKGDQQLHLKLVGQQSRLRFSWANELERAVITTTDVDKWLLEIVPVALNTFFTVQGGWGSSEKCHAMLTAIGTVNQTFLVTEDKEKSTHPVKRAAAQESIDSVEHEGVTAQESTSNDQQPTQSLRQVDVQLLL